MPNGEGASEHENFENKPTQPKTDSSACFGKTGPLKFNTLQLSKALFCETTFEIKILSLQNKLRSQ
ncbi:MAG: hypothetical protein JSR93_06670 [Verrucomicrobia bacterium]|nr:hypothetical protein [Verrucomicrobiota bacterium]